MKYRIRRIITLLLITPVLVGYDAKIQAGDGKSGPTESQVQSVSAKKFLVFDGTLYKNKPDLSMYGIRPLNIIYGGRFWEKGKSKDQLPDKDTVRGLAREAAAKGNLTVIDIEHWSLRADDAVVAESVKK